MAPSVDHNDNGFIVMDSKESNGGYKSSVAAMKLQKVYRSYCTQHRLADSVVVAEELCTNHGSEGSKWIFVMSASKKLYAGEPKINAILLQSEKEGIISSFQLPRRRSNFGSWKTYGRRWKANAYSGHYRPSNENLDNFLAFLKENGVDAGKVQVISVTEDNESCGISKSAQERRKFRELEDPEPPKSKSQRTSVPKKEILQRIKSKKEVKSYQLGHQLSLTWSTGAGPRIGRVADYPQNLRVQALQYVDLSPRASPRPSDFKIPTDLTPLSKICNIM
ncbi:IQ domain-containing protein IQM3 [Citrus sinensis]|nr:IQ domain-containing protein IQM3 [Citrus sinensis]